MELQLNGKNPLIGSPNATIFFNFTVSVDSLRNQSLQLQLMYLKTYENAGMYFNNNFIVHIINDCSGQVNVYFCDKPSKI